MSSFVARGRSIIAIGRNYAEHAKELGNKVPSRPFWFLKPTSSYVESPGTILIPKGVVAHHEVELGVVISKPGQNIERHFAYDHVAGYTLAIDMTARNMQDEAKSKGLPWSTAKGFDTFTPIGPFIPKASIPDPQSLHLWLKVNGSMKQDGNTRDMIFDIPALIEHVSSVMSLQENDLILTGTPSGVGPVVAGDAISAGLDNAGNELSKIEFEVQQRIGGYQHK